MPKFIFIMLLAVFAVAGAVLIFADIEEEKPVSGLVSTPDNLSFDYGSFEGGYASSSLAERIAGDCYEGEPECAAALFIEYVRDEFIADEKEAAGKTLQEVIRERKGTREQISGVLESLLSSAGIKTVVEVRHGVKKVYACDLDVPVLYNEIRKRMRLKILAKRELTLKKGGVWAVDMKNPGGGPLSIGITAVGTAPFNVLLFKNDPDMRVYLKTGTENYIKGCAAFGVTKTELNCSVPAGSRLAFVSQADGNVFTGIISKGGFIMSDIKTEDFGGIACVDTDMDF